ncbi:unnamed protein product [Bemisia tabaci]|uniref:Phospholipase A-2-activating protein n=1 Tax=Bemisia tabaci TaxID=7038 RepID=A0A9P0ANN8_BEMTA|nr:unnamed protein product [Bemisia tabaci]
MEYKLSVCLYGHTADVRALAATHNGCIVSASRDKTAKIWKPNELNAVYSDVQTLHGHRNFVSSICALPPSDGFPDGLIVTGSNDKIINVYTPECSDPILKLEGHTNTVCNLRPGLQPATFVSSSWDTTARVWSVKDKTTLLTITGHSAAVWSAIQLSSGIIVTAGADKTIRVHLPDGSFKASLVGHNDVVRDLAPLTDTLFLSCSNDATIKQWNAASGECLETLYGHPNFIYCLSVFGDTVASSGEDRNVHIWQKGQSQSLMLPAQSVWCVVCLPNGDIATGSSDGIVRVFSADPSRQADEATLAAYNEEVTSAGISSQKEIGGVKVADLPGPEVLVHPGTKDGQNKMINENGKVILYSWSNSSQEWTKIGDVMGTNDGKDEATTPGKVKYMGKEYDYVFDVDIEDGKPAIKLPYNKGDDPWHAAQNFIHQNNLNQQFLEQVANFIINNAKGSEPAPPPTSSNYEYVDPFTGGARYIPGGSATGNPVNMPQTDPFTGGSRYVPGGSVSNVPEISSKFFPQRTCLCFEAGNVSLINDKLVQFNDKITNESLKLDPVSLSKLVEIANSPASVTPELFAVLQVAYQWPEELVFPVLDITRLGIRNLAVNSALCSEDTGDFLLSSLNQKLSSQVDTNRMLALRVFSNMLQHPPGRDLALKNKDMILLSMSVSSMDFSAASKHLQVAAVTILLNLAIIFTQQGSKDDLANTLQVLSGILPKLSDPEAIFRALVAVGTILSSAPLLKVMVMPDIKNAIEQISQNSNSDNRPGIDKVRACSQDVLKVL